MTDTSSFEVPYPQGYCTFQDRCIVYPDPAEEKTKGGIIIPDTAKEKPQAGTVVLVGPDIEQNHGIKIGDRVYYGKFTQEVEIDKVKYHSVRISEIIVSKVVGEAQDTKRQKATMHT